MSSGGTIDPRGTNSLHSINERKRKMKRKPSDWEKSYKVLCKAMNREERRNLSEILRGENGKAKLATKRTKDSPVNP